MRPRRTGINKEIEALAAMPDEDIDTSSIPEMRNWWTGLRGRFFRRASNRVVIDLDERSVENMRAWFRAFFLRCSGATFLPSADFSAFDAEYLRRLQYKDPGTEAHFASYFDRRLQMKLQKLGFPDSMIDTIIEETLARVLTRVKSGPMPHPERFAFYVGAVCDEVVRERAPALPDALRSDLRASDAKSSDDPEFTLLEERRKAVEEVLASLSTKKRNILRALLYEQLSANEICLRFRIKHDFLRVLLFRTKEEFVKRAKTLMREKRTGSSF